VNIAPEPILKAGLMTLHWATVFARNWTYSPDVPVKMVNDLMDAIHDVPSQLMHWNEGHSFHMLIQHLSSFDDKSWKVQVDDKKFSIPKLADFFRERLQEFSGDETIGNQ
jgi:hypothetical protein